GGGGGGAAPRGGALHGHLRAGARTVLDLACGTGIVTTRLHRPGRAVVGVDRSAGMAAVAAGRLPRRVVLGDAARLPVGAARLDAVVLVWLLHLLDDAEPVLAEAARVLRPGGRLVTTVDKDRAAFTTDSDIARLTAPLRREHAAGAADRPDRIAALAHGLGLRPAGETAFRGTGQGRSPRAWRTAVEAGRIPWARAAGLERAAALCRDLAALPDQDRPRPDPQYRLLALQRA
ncbi:class I SAM-dependent methyltransferase, partial [Kitasatospora sp. NPDC059571]|uniref:class I SAM-dependent methyltransferase n=1 Tax=Kitasatospora sp. NPDC059571 TaxID=3346871 RepID=UPI00369ACFE0